MDSVLDTLPSGAPLAPAILLAAAVVAAPVFDLIQRLRRRSLLRRIRRNTCRYCGYGLRENTHRCAECGGFIASTPERVDALRNVADDPEPVEADNGGRAASAGPDGPDLTGTDPSAGSPRSPG